MNTLLFSHPACARHATGPGHPERPERLAAIRRAIEASSLTSVIDAPEPEAVSPDLLEEVHTRAYIAKIEAIARSGGGWLDQDTPVSAASATAAAHAAGAAQRAAVALAAGQADRAFVIVRPPGHHALPDSGMGFCLYNNVAVAARAARRAGCQRVMIVDWDVHHGNGTQAVFWRDPAVLFVSMHQEYWYPGTGTLEENGAGAGEGFTFNVPLPAETGDGGYCETFEEVVLPLASAFTPDFLIVSAGYDSHFSDPLGGMVVTAPGFGRLARLLDGVAMTNRIPLLAVLEGGYDLQALGASVVATLEVMAGLTASSVAPEQAPPEVSASAIHTRLRDVRRVMLNYWRT